MAAVAVIRLCTVPDIYVSVVGEVWQEYREQLEELAAILPRDRLTVVDRYVADDEVPAFFAAAHLVVLPYRRSWASGPLHIAMNCGLPKVTTSVGGLVEATADYTGAVLVPPCDPVALAEDPYGAAASGQSARRAALLGWERRAAAALRCRIDAMFTREHGNSCQRLSRLRGVFWSRSDSRSEIRTMGGGTYVDERNSRTPAANRG
jgi:glycosyltransferase involved in cell wall biosynthesis